jgi:hypothetical protein
MNNFKQHDQLWSGKIRTLNHLSYFSAGAISLSVTFLGHILSIGSSVRSILQELILWKISILFVLFGSWAFLFLAVFFGIVIEFFIGRYIYYSQTALLFEGFKTTVKEEDKKNVDLAIGSAKISAETFEKISYWIQMIAIFSFALGIFLLMMFAMLVAQRLALP